MSPPSTSNGVRRTGRDRDSPDDPTKPWRRHSLDAVGSAPLGNLVVPGLVGDPLLYAWGLVDLAVLFFSRIAHGSSSSGPAANSPISASG
jgi:hypothetical protein